MAALVLVGYSIFLLDFTYLEPLPWRSGQIGVVLLLVAALGAGMLSGWRWPTLVLIVVCAFGVAYPSGSLQQEGRWWSEHGSEVDGTLILLALVPAAVGLGALLGRLGPPSRVAGGAILALPLVVVVWASVRHADPIDRKPAHPLLVSFPVNSDVLLIRDPRAQTAKGVGIGDNLSLVPSRYRADCDYDYPQSGFQPECSVTRDPEGVSEMIFIGDPIERIKVY